MKKLNTVIGIALLILFIFLGLYLNNYRNNGIKVNVYPNDLTPSEWYVETTVLKDGLILDSVADFCEKNEIDSIRVKQMKQIKK